MPEVAPQTAGNWHVGGQKVWTGFESWQVTPDIEQIVVALQQAYDESKEDQDLRRRSVFEHAKWYSADHVVDTFWKPALSAARAEFILRRKKMHKF
jgi:hypothetical protein